MDIFLFCRGEHLVAIFKVGIYFTYVFYPLGVGTPLGSTPRDPNSCLFLFYTPLETFFGFQFKDQISLFLTRYFFYPPGVGTPLVGTLRVPNLSFFLLNIYPRNIFLISIYKLTFAIFDTVNFLYIDGWWMVDGHRKVEKISFGNISKTTKYLFPMFPFLSEKF